MGSGDAAARGEGRPAPCHVLQGLSQVGAEMAMGGREEEAPRGTGEGDERHSSPGEEG